MIVNVTLKEPDREKMRTVNKLLWELTDSHHHCCLCNLCCSRTATDVQEEESYTIYQVDTGEEL